MWRVLGVFVGWSIGCVIVFVLAALIRGALVLWQWLFDEDAE